MLLTETVSMFRKFAAFIIHPFFIALILTIVVILLTPGKLFTKYKIHILDDSKFKLFERLVRVDDLNNDGLSEWLFMKKNVRGEASVNVYNNNMDMIRQYDFPGKSFVDNNLKV